MDSEFLLGVEHAFALLGGLSVITACTIFFYKAQSKRQESIDLLKQIKTIQSEQREDDQKVASMLDRAANTLDKIEKRMNEHEKENVQGSHQISHHAGEVRHLMFPIEYVIGFVGGIVLTFVLIFFSTRNSRRESAENATLVVKRSNENIRLQDELARMQAYKLSVHQGKKGQWYGSLRFEGSDKADLITPGRGGSMEAIRKKFGPFWDDAKLEKVDSNNHGDIKT